MSEDEAEIARTIELALLRSGKRPAVVIALDTLGRAQTWRIAWEASVAIDQARGILLGALPEYSEERSLVGLGLARRVVSDTAEEFEITARGRLVAGRVRHGAAPPPRPCVHELVVTGMSRGPS